jgi:hypothetical protein
MSRILLQKKSGQIIPGGATTPFTEQPRQEASNAPSNQFAGPGVPTGNYGAATSGSASGAFLANYVTREDDNLNFSRGGGGGTGGTGGTSMGAPSTAGMSESKAEFIAKAWPLAVKAGQETGIDPRIILAQAGIESGWGKHAPNNNYFGIKGQGGTFMTDEVINGKRVRMAQSFAGYGSMEASFQGYADFINRNQRYGRLKQGGSLATQASNLQATGYATDPDYGGKVLGVASGLQVPALGSETAGATASMSGGAGGGRSFSIENNTVINVAAGPDAQATASAVAFNQTRVNEQHVRLSEGKIR